MFGKGPSLNTYDFSQAGDIRCAINDVAGIVPNCTYAFANDAINDWDDVYQPQTILFSPQRTYSDKFFEAERSKTCSEHVLFYDRHDNHTKLLKTATPDSLLRDGLVIRRGTLGSAIQILWIMGISKIVCVGIDGGGQHSSRAEWRTRLRNLHAMDYNAIRDAFIEAAGWLCIELEFHGCKTLMRNGKMKIKIIKQTFVGDGVGWVGKTYEVNPGEGNLLVASGKAVVVKDDEAPQPEPLAPEIPAAEKARIETPERPKLAKKRASRKRKVSN